MPLDVSRSEKLTREEALRAMTLNGAYLTFEENVKGSIEADKYADLIVIDRDYLTIDDDEIKDINVLMTMVGGEIVHHTD
jgi:predicted amidohydrolase YtcJ